MSAAPNLTPAAVYQDGADFYSGGRVIARAPFSVSDSDMAGAIRAREWFLAEWAPLNSVAPSFEESGE